MIHHTCPHCQVSIKAPDRFTGREVRCPNCLVTISLPLIEAELVDESEIVDAEVVPQTPAPAEPEQSSWDIEFLSDLHGPRKVEEFLEPPAEEKEYRAKQTTGGASPKSSDWMKKMFAAMLDPRSIQWLLTLGGGLMVLGGLIWLISWGAFEDPLIAAIILGTGSLGVLIGGWAVVLKTRYKLAGRALTFLGCVFVSLNLWFYHAQGLLLLEQSLWIGGIACVLLYVATTWLLRDPLFTYAIQAGVTLTAVLLLGNLGLASNATSLSVVLVALAFASIHAHRAFPVEAETFTQDRFGLPLFWCGHIQLAAALIVLLGSQLAGVVGSVEQFFALPAGGIPLTESRWLPALLWLVGAYMYLYSDLAVRRIGLYVYLAAVSLVMAEATFIGFDLMGVEGLIATLAVTATVISLASSFMADEKDDRVARTVPPLALVLSVLPVALGMGLHWRTTSVIASELGLFADTTWIFVAAMCIVAVANRVSAFVYQDRSPSLSAVYVIFSAGGLVVAAAGTLRMLEFVDWHTQTMWMMLIPLGYLVAAQMWKGKAPERPVAWVAHVTLAIILAHVFFGAMASYVRGFESIISLRLAIILAQAALFFGISAAYRNQRTSTYLAVAAATASAWQLMVFKELPHEVFTTAFGFLGVAMIVIAHWLGIEDEQIYRASGKESKIAKGAASAALRSGQAILSFALLIGLMKAIAQLAAVGLDIREIGRYDWFALGTLTIAAIAGALASQTAAWKRVYTTFAVALAAVGFMTLNIALDISPWRKAEVFLVIGGLIALVASYIGRFREEEDNKPNELVSTGLWMGSIMSSIPLLIAVFVQWRMSDHFALFDELALIGVALLMLASGIVWQIKSATLFGGGSLSIYLCVLVISLIHQPQVAIGIYLTAGGGLLFVAGLLLAVYRDHLLALTEQVANREGLFKVINWR
ncbi:MAG: hypothetical protein ACI9G1_001194 [Pirellulaceae bacterium]|jgi:hypothetical protein